MFSVPKPQSPMLSNTNNSNPTKSLIHIKSIGLGGPIYLRYRWLTAPLYVNFCDLIIIFIVQHNNNLQKKKRNNNNNNIKTITTVGFRVILSKPHESEKAQINCSIVTLRSLRSFS